MTWTADDQQASIFSDGYGLPDACQAIFHNVRAIRIEGTPDNARFRDVSTYPQSLPFDPEVNARYYGFGVLAVEDSLYHFLTCAQKPTESGWAWSGNKLIYSPDQGYTWHNQDGSTPVVWESWPERSRESMLFFDEPQDTFSLISLLQMGRNYAANTDGCVYGYAPNGNTDGTMNQLVMFRVAKKCVLDRSAYEFFGGLKSGGDATWTRDIRERGIVHTFPRGWVNTTRNKGQNVLQSWVPSVVFNAPLGLYLMAASGVGCDSNGEWFEQSKPSYLGFWVARKPWGPWTQIHEETAWLPANNPTARCYSPQISPKWMAADGKSFWLVWSDFLIGCGPEESKRRSETVSRILDENEKARFNRDTFQLCLPTYMFKTQRFDVIIKS